MKSKLLGVLLLVVGLTMLFHFSGKAIKEITVVKYTCFGACVLTNKEYESVSKIIDIEKLQSENVERRIRGEFYRNKNKAFS